MHGRLSPLDVTDSMSYNCNKHGSEHKHHLLLLHRGSLVLIKITVYCLIFFAIRGQREQGENLSHEVTTRLGRTAALE